MNMRGKTNLYPEITTFKQGQTFTERTYRQSYFSSSLRLTIGTIIQILSFTLQKCEDKMSSVVDTLHKNVTCTMCNDLKGLQCKYRYSKRIQLSVFPGEKRKPRFEGNLITVRKAKYIAFQILPKLFQLRPFEISSSTMEQTLLLEHQYQFWLAEIKINTLLCIHD